MKLKSIFTIAILSTNMIVIKAQDNELFNKLSDDDNISKVFISKAILQMVPLNMGGAKKCTIIRISGSFTMEDIRKVIKN